MIQQSLFFTKQLLREDSRSFAGLQAIHARQPRRICRALNQGLPDREPPQYGERMYGRKMPNRMVRR